MTVAVALAFAIVSAPEPDPWLGSDKLLHFGATTVISGVGYGFAAELTEDLWPRFLFGAALGFAAAGGKEIADLAGLGTPSWRDLTWSAAGSLAGLLVAWLIDRGLGGAGANHYSMISLFATRGAPAPIIVAPCRSPPPPPSPKASSTRRPREPSASSGTCSSMIPRSAR